MGELKQANDMNGTRSGRRSSADSVVARRSSCVWPRCGVQMAQTLFLPGAFGGGDTLAYWASLSLQVSNGGVWSLAARACQVPCISRWRRLC